MDSPLEETKTSTIADLLEDQLIEQLTPDAEDPDKLPTAALLSVARQYLRDQGFVALKRPNARFHEIADHVERYVEATDMPFPSDDEPGVA
ncbi:MAG: hypothetical protein GY701_28805 [Sulfitobacter sp.]|nr:hypothetical protein [Sulfitobacter sp.]